MGPKCFFDEHDYFNGFRVIKGIESLNEKKTEGYNLTETANLKLVFF
jgi:hypothetical protein